MIPWLASLLSALAVAAGGPSAPKYISLSPLPEVRIHPGETVTLSVKFKVDPGIHVQANPASRRNLIATTVTFEEDGGIRPGTPLYPPGKPFRLKGSDSDISTYDGEVEIKLPLTASADAKEGRRKLKGKLRYQACEEASCFFPMTVPLEAQVLLLKQK